jgi:sugar phosphate isomerase/epimerase
VAITLDAAALDPYQDPASLARELAATRSLLDRRGLARVVETGARYLLNPRLKHDPTLMDPDPLRREVREDFLKRSIDIARALGAECVSIWSGRLHDAVEEEPALDRLAAAMTPILDHAAAAGIPLAFEPEPGMFIDTMERFGRLDERIGHPLFGLTMDLGHVHCIEDGPVSAHIHRWASRIINIHAEDMIRGVHEHLMFGEGTMDFPAIFEALRTAGYDRGIHVELSRHGHAAVEAVRASTDFLTPLLRP